MNIDRHLAAQRFVGRVLDRILILTCWTLLALMVAVFALAALGPLL